MINPGSPLLISFVCRSILFMGSLAFSTGLLLPSSSSADNGNPSNRAVPLSHLDFDRPVATTQTKTGGPTNNDIQAILEGVKPVPLENGPSGSTGQPSGGQGSAGEGRVQSFEWVKPIEGQGHFLTPRLRGPSVDANHPTTITTENKWDKQSGSCEVSRSDLLCQKAKALRELFVRFSGDPDFYTRQCQQRCDSQGQEAVLTAFRFKDRKRQSYDILQAGDKCRYQFGAVPGTSSWLLMEGEAGTCKCLPRGCSQ